MSKDKPGKFVRDAAIQVLERVDKEGAYAEALLNDLIGKGALSDRDRGLLIQLVKGTLKHQRSLDAELQRHLNRELADLPPSIRCILRMGTFQLLHLDRVPVSAAVNTSVDLAKQYGHQGTAKLVNAILRAISRNTDHSSPPDSEGESVESIATQYSHPDWLVERWIKRLGKLETIKLCQSNNCPLPLSLRVNSVRTESDTLFKELVAVGAEVKEGRISNECIEVLRLPPNQQIQTLPGFDLGHFTVQDQSAAMVAPLFEPRANESFLDLCAAPGGKATHLAQLSKDQGLIVAVDRHYSRFRRLTQNCSRLGLNSIKFVQGDGLELSFGKEFAGVLVDAPCSGLGVIARNSDLRWQKQEGDLRELSELQGDLLRAASRHVATNGRLVYATCSLEPEENEDVVLKFLEEDSHFQRIHLGTRITPELVTPDGFMEIWPHKHGTAGAFAALMVRKS